MKVKISKIPICMYSSVRYNMALIKYKGDLFYTVIASMII